MANTQAYFNKEKESKWRRDEKGAMVKSTCPMCEEEEDRGHYEYGCKVVTQLRGKIVRRAGRQNAQISKEEWALETDVEETLKVLIAKARWVYHCERCNIDHGKRKRMNLEIVMQRLDRRMKVIEAP